LEKDKEEAESRRRKE